MAVEINPDAVSDHRQRLDSNWNWAMDEANRHFRRENEVLKTLRKLASQLERLGIPYAIAGSMAMFQYGFRRLNIDVDVLVTCAGLSRIHEKLAELGYVPPFAGGKNLRNAEYGVHI